MTPRDRLLAIASALAHVDAAIERLSSAHTAAVRTLPVNSATVSLAHACIAARIARAKLEIVMRRLP